MIEGEDLELFERTLRHATGTTTGPALDAALADLGWADALGVDRRAAVSLLFELQGAAGATSSALDRVLADALGVGADGVAVVLGPVGHVGPPREGTTVRGLATFAALDAESLLVAGDDGVATVPASGLRLRRVGGLDPDLGLVEVAGEVAATATVEAPWAAAVAAGQLALAHELVGASRTMLAQAREHALERVQFGQPIAGFQAVRHRLAEALVAVEAADAAVDAAWVEGSPVYAGIAKAVAGRSARTVAKHAQQVLAGIGFTTEHPLHRSVRRVLVLDELLGNSRSLTRALGDQLLRDRHLPPLLPL